MEDFTKALVQDFERLSDSLDATYVRTDEYAYLLTKVYQDVARDYQQEKLDAYRNVLVNALRVKIPASSQENYLSLVEQFTTQHIMVFASLVDAQAPETVGTFTNVAIADDQLARLFELVPGITKDQFRPALMHLAFRGLLELTGPIERGPSCDGRLTPFGREFHVFISAA